VDDSVEALQRSQPILAITTVSIGRQGSVRGVRPADTLDPSAVSRSTPPEKEGP